MVAGLAPIVALEGPVPLQHPHAVGHQVHGSPSEQVHPWLAHQGEGGDAGEEHLLVTNGRERSQEVPGVSPREEHLHGGGVVRASSVPTASCDSGADGGQESVISLGQTFSHSQQSF